MAAIALAVLAWPRILLADEPVAGTAPAAADASDLLLWIPLVSYALAPIMLAWLWRVRSWRPPPAGTPTPWRLSAGVSFALFALSIVAGAIVAGVVASWTTSSVTDESMRLAIGSWAGVLGGLLGAAPGLAIAAQEPARPGANRPVGFGLGLAVGAIGLVVALPIVQAVASLGQVVQQALSGHEPDPIAHDTLQLLMSTTPDLGWWLVAAGAVIGAPVLEEVLYRGLLQQGMRRLEVSPWIAISATSALFALMHLPAIPAEGRISAITGLLVLSLGLGAIRERTGRLSPCILAHGLFNAFNLAVASAVST